MKYSLWIEFEEYADPTDIADGYCNITITFENGRKRSFNVWTLKCFLENTPDIIQSVEENGYADFPDLIVKELTRPQIEDALAQILPRDVDFEKCD